MAYIKNEDIKAIRTELKNRFPKMRFSVTKRHHSSAVISIMKGPKSLESMFDSDYQREDRYAQLNHFYPQNYGEHETLIKEISEIAHNAPGRAGGSVYFDESDAMTDYFHTAFYVRLAIGKWDKPFEVM